MYDIQKMKEAHKIIKEWDYEFTPLYRGYTDKILYVNLSDNTIKEKAVPEQMKEKFIGGKGYGLRLLWDATTPETKWDEPENEINIFSGPIGGITQYSGTGKSLVVSLSPQTDIAIDSNVTGDPRFLTCAKLREERFTKQQNPSTKRFQRTLFIRIKHNMPIFGLIPLIKLQNDT